MTYELAGRIDSMNAAKFETNLMASYEANGKLELDAAKLQYISSAGLRVLLKLRKRQGELTVLNVSPEIYDIFEVTGFTEFLDIQKA